MKNNKFYDYGKLNEITKDLYTVKRTNSIDVKLILIKDYFNKLHINSNVYCDTDGIYIILEDIYGCLKVLYFPIESSVYEVYSNTLKFISISGGLRKWQTQTN